jgi:hypothetical protein
MVILSDYGKGPELHLCSLFDPLLNAAYTYQICSFLDNAGKTTRLVG